MPPKRGAFSDYTIVISQKRDTFCAFAILGMASGGAYAIRPYTGPQKINAFSRSIMYPVNFLGLGRGLDFLLPSFLSSRKGPYRGREAFSWYIFKINHVPGLFPRPRQRP